MVLGRFPLGISASSGAGLRSAILYQSSQRNIHINFTSTIEVESRLWTFDPTSSELVWLLRVWFDVDVCFSRADRRDKRIEWKITYNRCGGAYTYVAVHMCGVKEPLVSLNFDFLRRNAAGENREWMVIFWQNRRYLGITYHCSLRCAPVIDRTLSFIMH